MKAKDPIWIFLDITEDHEDDFKKTARCRYGTKCCVLLSAESKRLKAHHLKCCDYTAMFCSVRTNVLLDVCPPLKNVMTGQKPPKPNNRGSPQ